MEYFRRGVVLSTGGTAEEPGSMAMFLNIIVPLGLWHFHRAGKRRMVYLLGAMYILSLLLITSMAGLAIFAFFGSLLVLANLRVMMPYLKWAVPAAGIGIALVVAKFYEYILLFGQDMTQDLLLKVSMSSDSRSAEMRSSSLKGALDSFAQSPWFGNGPGYGIESLSDGYLNVFLTVLADIGIFAFLLFFAFLAITVTKAMRLPRPAPYFLFLPIFGTLAHFNIIGDYYHAPFWMALAMVQLWHARETQAGKAAAGPAPALPAASEAPVATAALAGFPLPPGSHP